MTTLYSNVSSRALMLFFSLGLIICVMGNLIFIRLTALPILAIWLLIMPWAQLPFHNKRWRATEWLFATTLTVITGVFYWCFAGDQRASFFHLSQESQVLTVGFASIMFGISKIGALIKNRILFGKPTRKASPLPSKQKIVSRR